MTIFDQISDISLFSFSCIHPGRCQISAGLGIPDVWASLLTSLPAPGRSGQYRAWNATPPQADPERRGFQISVGVSELWEEMSRLHQSPPNPIRYDLGNVSLSYRWDLINLYIERFQTRDHGRNSYGIRNQSLLLQGAFLKHFKTHCLLPVTYSNECFCEEMVKRGHCLHIFSSMFYLSESHFLLVLICPGSEQEVS